MPARATRGKVVRAEPVAALYQQDRIHHVGAFATLVTAGGGHAHGDGRARPAPTPRRHAAAARPGRVRDAGVFALELCDFVSATRWSDYDLPASFNVRIGVHAGPVYQVHDP